MALNNKLGILDSVELAKAEEKISKKKAKELFESGYLDNLESGTYETLSKVHQYLFEDIYEFAGKIRTVNLAKNLIKFYTTGDLKDFNDYSIEWVQDLDSRVDFVNGFTETYGDPLGLKASWESLVNFKDIDATRRTELISQNAQWFENNSPVDPQFKKKEVKGVSAKDRKSTRLNSSHL